jgi:SRSO17 transposase
MPWQNGKKYTRCPKYELALNMIEWALDRGFPACTVLADSWFGSEPFVKGLKRLRLSYVLEVKRSYTIKTPCKEQKLTPTGKPAKNQLDKIKLPDYFKAIKVVTQCGFASDPFVSKDEKVLYNTKIATARLSSIPGKHRIVQSIDPLKQTAKYLITDQLTFEASKILSMYSHRWVIEEFFRNAKQLSSMGSHYQERARRNTSVVPGVLD